MWPILRIRVIAVKALGTAACCRASAGRTLVSFERNYEIRLGDEVHTLARNRFVSCRGDSAWVLAGGIVFASLAVSQGNPHPELRLLAASCAACHGTDGHSQPNSSIPSLARLPAAYFLERMHAFQEDKKLSSTVMAQIAKGFNDQQLEELATYFADQP